MPRIAPRVPPPLTVTGRSESQPADVAADHIGRLQVFSLVGVGLWSTGLMIEVWVTPRGFGTASVAAIAISAAGVVTGLTSYALAKFSPMVAARSDAGLFLLVLNSFYVALLETWVRSPVALNPTQPSWVTPIILLTAMILPSAPRKMSIAVTLAASMGPLGVAIAWLRGSQVPPLGTAVLIFLPTYLCAVAAVTPSIVFERLSRRLREARELGAYELIEPLGSGGMGEVWRGRHRWLARDAAVKLMRAEPVGPGLHQQARMRRFEREARATAQLSSPHSIRLYDFGATDDQRFYYAMELLVGRDLDTLVREFGPLCANRTMFLMRQVCHSLDEAHERGLVHRDIKPANIYVCRLGQDYDFIKVLDFGLVKFNGGASSQTPTQTAVTTRHEILGTPAFMSPEAILGRSDVDRRADVYALGCVAYYLLTGRQVFESDSPMRALIDHVSTEPSAPSVHAKYHVPADLDAIVLACLAKDPQKRPPDAKTLRHILHDCQTCSLWSNTEAEEWWRIHLPALSGPLMALDTARLA